MKYYKAPISIENGRKKYGNLPIGFVLGYENTILNEAYFVLVGDVSVPDDADIIEISKSEYDESIEEVNRINLENRNNSDSDILDHMKQRKEENELLWQMVTDLQLELLSTNQFLTDAQLEIEMLKGGD